ncbi:MULTISPECIES: hypothetical protein [unclassified Aeromonas]|uniref:hypothetical protein n=1 Tax=unclassified Aeromonas TaxID=257493 RepID=UPI003BA3CE14
MKAKMSLIMLLIVTANAQSQTREDSDTILKTIEKSYSISYPNGSADKFVYVFTAHIKAFMAQHGSSSTLTHPVDTRRCNYNVSSYIQREAFYVTGSGKRVPEGALKKITGPQEWRRQSDSLFEQSIGRHSPCNDYVGDFNLIKSRVSSSILNSFDMILMQDIIPQSENDAKSVLKASSFIVDE